MVFHVISTVIRWVNAGHKSTDTTKQHLQMYMISFGNYSPNYAMNYGVRNWNQIPVDFSSQLTEDLANFYKSIMQYRTQSGNIP